MGAAGAPAIGDDAADRIRANLERTRVPCFLASSREDRSTAAVTSPDGVEGLSHVSGRLIPGSAHAMAIYFDVREELLQFLLPVLGVR